MSAFVVATVALVLLTGLAGAAVLRGSTIDRVVALQLVSVLLPLLAVAIAVLDGRTTYLDVALALAVLSLAGSLAYARFLERWL